MTMSECCGACVCALLESRSPPMRIVPPRSAPFRRGLAATQPDLQKFGRRRRWFTWRMRDTTRRLRTLSLSLSLSRSTSMSPLELIPWSLGNPCCDLWGRQAPARRCACAHESQTAAGRIDRSRKPRWFSPRRFPRAHARKNRASLCAPAPSPSRPRLLSCSPLVVHHTAPRIVVNVAGRRSRGRRQACGRGQEDVGSVGRRQRRRRKRRVRR